MKKLITFLSVLLISGCSSFSPPAINVTGTQVVDVPIVTRCDPSVKVTPIDHVFDQAKKEIPLEDKTKLALSELNSVNGQNAELLAALKECTK
jgi:hypothetical protein